MENEKIIALMVVGVVIVGVYYYIKNKQRTGSGDMKKTPTGTKKTK